jgi:hypothetical protein
MEASAEGPASAYRQSHHHCTATYWAAACRGPKQRHRVHKEERCRRGRRGTRPSAAVGPGRGHRHEGGRQAASCQCKPEEHRRASGRTRASATPGLVRSTDQEKDAIRGAALVQLVVQAVEPRAEEG